jgi:2-oxoglutarate ferredoxin oxidoreductase subunit alpha
MGKNAANSVNIVIGGEAGQGLVTVGQLLAKSLARSGYSILVTQTYQSRIRGGHNTFAIRAGVDEVIAPQEAIDLLVALTGETVRLHREELTTGGLILADARFNIVDDACLNVPFAELASERYINTAALGVIARILGIDQQVAGRAVQGLLGKVHPDVEQENMRALKAGFNWGTGRARTAPTLTAVDNPPQRLMMNGNEAIALGAIAGGLKFYAFYPMTPSTSIGNSLAGWARELGLIVEQAEGEIAAINMVLGASFAGAPSMVATSGGGFALMTEAVSLAGMTETPVVICVVQRPAPATGLPTRTEQGDLEFVLHAGHGEFPRAVFAPGSVEECFWLTKQAFHLADKYQGPVFILSDQFLADSYRTITPFEIDGIPPVQPWSTSELKISAPYRRFALTDTGVSPRMLPGLTGHLVVADSDEHTEDGHITEDLSMRVRMVRKRLAKGEGIRSAVVPPERLGDEEPEVLLLCWGSSRGAVLEAAEELRSRGKRAAALHFSQVWPLVPAQFIDDLQEAHRVICVEGNATGQMARLIRRETGFEIAERVLRFDGLPITPQYILRQLAQEAAKELKIW